MPRVARLEIEILRVTKISAFSILPLVFDMGILLSVVMSFDSPCTRLLRGTAALGSVRRCWRVPSLPISAARG